MYKALMGGRCGARAGRDMTVGVVLFSHRHVQYHFYYTFTHAFLVIKHSYKLIEKF